MKLKVNILKYLVIVVDSSSLNHPYQRICCTVFLHKINAAKGYEVDELKIGVEPLVGANLQSMPGNPCLDE